MVSTWFNTSLLDLFFSIKHTTFELHEPTVLFCLPSLGTHFLSRPATAQHRSASHLLNTGGSGYFQVKLVITRLWRSVGCSEKAKGDHKVLAKMQWIYLLCATIMEVGIQLNDQEVILFELDSKKNYIYKKNNWIKIIFVVQLIVFYNMVTSNYKV